MRKYIIDTDIGDDIDDAFALDLALKKDLGLAGITTVFKNTDDRARIAKKMLALAGKDVPVYAGLSQTLDGITRTTEHCCQWTDDLANGKYSPEDFNGGRCDENAAIDFIVDCARKYGKDLYILAIGPLTNVAAAILRDKDAMEQIGGVIMMGGDYANQYVEWNIFCDVKAAEVLFTSKLNVTAFGHEVTSKFSITESQQEYIFNMNKDAYSAYLAELSRLWVVSKPLPNWRIVLHDVLVVRQALEAGYCKTKEIEMHLETESPYVYGMTVNLDKCDLVKSPAGKKITIAIDPDMREILDTEMKIIGYREDNL